MNLAHSFKVNKNNEAQQLTFSATALNLLNQHSVVAYWQGLNSDYVPSALFQPDFVNQFGIFGGAPFYQQVETGYDPQAAITASTVPLHSQYGTPNQWQISRNLRLAVRFTW
jgi:hypothetical protein